MPERDLPCGDHAARIINVEKRQEAFEVALNKVRDRLPNWAVIAMSLLTGVVGWLLRG